MDLQPAPIEAKKLQLPDAEINKHLDTILRASGSALRYFSTQQTIDNMRLALRRAISELAKP